MNVRVGIRKLSAEELMLLNCGVGEDSWESLGQQGDPTSHPKGNQSWIFTGRTDADRSSDTLATWCKEQTHWTKPWCWERLKAGGEEGGNRGLDGWMASLTQLNDFEKTLEDGEGQGSLACCSP